MRDPCVPHGNARRNAEILKLRAKGVGPRSIARRLGVSPNVVAGVIHRSENPYVRKGRNGCAGMKNWRAILTDEQVLEIRRLRAQGEKLSALAAEFRTDESNICSIARGRTWKHLLPEAAE